MLEEIFFEDCPELLVHLLILSVDLNNIVRERRKSTGNFMKYTYFTKISYQHQIIFN